MTRIGRRWLRYVHNEDGWSCRPGLYRREVLGEVEFWRVKTPQTSIGELAAPLPHGDACYLAEYDVILVSETLAGDRLDDVLRHELGHRRCHERGHVHATYAEREACAERGMK
jgi:hypothetical protein